MLCLSLSFALSLSLSLCVAYAVCLYAARHAFLIDSPPFAGLQIQNVQANACVSLVI